MIDDGLAEVGVEHRDVGAAVDRPQLGRPANRTAFTEAPDRCLSSWDTESPVVIVGDSHTDFGSAQGSGIGHQLAFELGFPLDVLTTLDTEGLALLIFSKQATTDLSGSNIDTRGTVF